MKRELLQQKLREKIGDFQSLYSLSAGQQALWFLHTLAPHSPAYNIMCAARIDTDLDITRLRRAFEELANRHPSLRTTYKSVHGKPFQLVHERLAIDLEVQDASTWSREELNRIISQRADAPIDIERGIMRVCLFTQARDRQVLLLVLHHIAIDFWSLDLIIQELCVLYAIDVSKARMTLPRVTGSYADFVRRQKAIMDGPEGERLWRYWREKLAGELPVLNLCTDRPRPQVQTYEGASYRIELGDEIVKELKQFANARGATIFTAVLGVFTVLLHRYTHQDDIIVATPAIGRSQPELEGVVGYFSNPVALRSRFSSGQRFDDYLEELRQTVLFAIEHQDYPFPTLVKRLEVKRDPSRSPVFQAFFMWDKATWYDNRQLAGGLQLEPFAFGQRGAPFDISLTIVEKKTTLTAIFSYNTDLFEETTISRLANHFSVLLQGIIENPKQEIAKLPLLTEAERQRVLVEWNNTATYPRSLTVDQQITLQARESPEAIAVSFENDHLTYAALNRRANQLAHYLQSVGVSRNSLVGVMLDRSVDMVVALLGILKAGAAYLPLDPDYPSARLERMLSDARPTLLLTQQAPTTSLPTHGPQILCLDTERWRLEEQSDAEPANRASAQDLAYVIFTSGSSGGPKGVQVHHAALMNFLNAMKCHFSRSDVLVAVTTLSFDIAALEIFAPLIVGARTVIVRSEVAANGLSLAAALQQADATLMQATPMTWRLLLQAGWNPGKHVKALCGGEALPQALADRLLDRCSSLWNLYGPTETTIWSAAYKVDHGARTIVPIGKPIANTQIYILDARLQPVPVGVAGELYIGGDGVSVGYLNQAELTQTKFVANPFDESGETRLYKSGDLARFLADGNIEYLGRLDHQVKVNGFRIELAEIEAQLLRHPLVQEAVVNVQEDAPGVKRLVAYIVRRTTSSFEFSGPPDITISELRNFLKKSLPHFMLPTTCIFMDAFPLTPNGKLDRGALPAPDESRPALAEKYVAPRNRLENELSQAWATTLKLDRVGVKDNFFDLGGASLQSLEVTSRLSDAGINITPEMIFAHQTVAELALAIENGVTPIQRKEPAKRSDPMLGVPPHVHATPVNAWSAVKRCNLVMESLGVYLPSKSVSTEDVLAGCRNPVLFPLERLTGIKSRRVAGEDEFSIDLAKKAVADCLRKSKYRPEQIDVLICCNVSRYDGPDRFSFEPSTSLKLRSIFGFSNALVFDINNACAGMFTAIMISDALIKNGSAGCAMVVSGEYISHLTASAQREIEGFMDSRLACLTVGDAGAAVILEKSPNHEVGFQEIDMYTLGKYSPLCIAKITDGEHGGAIMYTDSIGQTAVATRNAVMHSADVMQRCGWSAESVDRLIMHQTSETTLRDVARALNDALGKPACHDGNVVYNLAERGNTATTTHFVALRDIIQKGEVKSGERVVFGISGSGQTVGTALYTLDDLPDRLRLFDSGETVPHRPEKSGGTPTRPKQFLPRVEITGIGLLARDHGLERVAITMARQAAENCLQDSSDGRNDIDLLIHAGIYRDDFLAEPAMAALLAGELKINDDIASIADKKSFVFDICNGAVGFLNACYVASQLIQAQRYRTAMIVASEIENNTNVFDVQRGVEETASAVMLRASAGGRTGLGHFVFKCKTEHIDALSTYTAKLDARTILRVEQDNRLQDFFVSCIPEAVEELLALEDLDVSQIAIVLGPQVSREFTTRLSETVRISRDKFVDVALGGKDLFTNSLAYSLQCANSKVMPGDIGLIISVGSGVQIGCAIYHF